MKDGGIALREGAGIMPARKYCVATAKVVGRGGGGAEAPMICVGRAGGAEDLEGMIEGHMSCHGLGGLEGGRCGFGGGWDGLGSVWEWLGVVGGW